MNKLVVQMRTPPVLTSLCRISLERAPSGPRRKFANLKATRKSYIFDRQGSRRNMQISCYFGLPSLGSLCAEVYGRPRHVPSARWGDAPPCSAGFRPDRLCRESARPAFGPRGAIRSALPLLRLTDKLSAPWLLRGVVPQISGSLWRPRHAIF